MLDEFEDFDHIIIPLGAFQVKEEAQDPYENPYTNTLEGYKLLPHTKSYWEACWNGDENPNEDTSGYRKSCLFVVLGGKQVRILKGAICLRARQRVCSGQVSTITTCLQRESIERLSR